MMNKICILIVFSIIYTSVFAQVEPLLVLKKPGTKHRINYFVGSDIVFKLEGEKHFNYGMITAITDSAVFINNIIIPYDAISNIANKSSVKTVRGLSKKSFLVIPVIVVYSLMLNGFDEFESDNFTKTPVFFLSSVFAGIGAAGYLYNGKNYRLKKRWQLVPVIM